MVHVAKEMKRRGLRLPLLIGGATTSKQHTAVKIAPAYEHPTVHVKDASRVVGVVASLLDPERKKVLDDENRVLQEGLRELHRQKVDKPLVPYSSAIRRRVQIEWRPEDIATPAFTGIRTLDDVPLGTLVDYIDWQFFFSAWEMRSVPQCAGPADPDRRGAAADRKGCLRVLACERGR
jgi:5-methyltetrahydrofolate--homocysteine methyltransferase